MPPEAVLKLQKMVYLRAVFQLHSSSPPNISLHMPEHLAALIGRLSCTHNLLAFCTAQVYTPLSVLTRSMLSLNMPEGSSARQSMSEVAKPL